MRNKIPAIVFEEVEKVSIREFLLDECGENEVVCETIYSFVSPGTELRVLGGAYSSPDDFPLVPGYSSVSRVVETGGEVKGFKVGDLVSCRNPIKPLVGIKMMWGGQAAANVYTTVGEDRPVLLPDDVEPLDYVVAEVAAISFRGVEAANPVAGETAVVFGQGLIGAFSAAWLMDRGCRVIACDIDEQRLEKAKQRGVSAVVNMGDSNADDRLSVICNGGADIVVESSGSTPGFHSACKTVRKKPQAYGADYKVEPIGFYHEDWARLILQANYIEDVAINPHGFFPGEGVTVLTPMDRGVEDRQKVVEAIRTGRLNANTYIDEIYDYRSAPDAYSRLQKREILSVVYKWGTDKNFIKDMKTEK